MSNVEGRKEVGDRSIWLTSKHCVTESRVAAAEFVDVGKSVLVRKCSQAIEASCKEGKVSIVHPAGDGKQSFVSDSRASKFSCSSHGDKYRISR